VGSATRPNAADADFAPSIASLQTGFRPLQAPVQRTNVHFGFGVASMVVVVPAGKEREHAEPQLMPVGVLLTIPWPTFVIATGKTVPATTNDATAADAHLAVTVHEGATPRHEPDQPANTQPASGVACSVTRVPTGRTAPQAVPQEIPAAGPEIDPFPVTLTASGAREGCVPPIAAVTERARVIGTTQAPVPVHAPPHATGPDAVSVTSTPAPKDATQASPQTMPGTSLVTDPPPAATAKANTVSGGAKVAVTARGSSILTEHPPVPVHAPVQPVNDQPGVGDADSVTVLSVANIAEHVAPQLMPAGWLVTVPLPLSVTASGNCVGRVRTNVALTSYVLPGSIGSIVHLSSPHEPKPSNAEPGSALANNVTGR
jgi:hypothetical protein